jgi:nitric oxide reductase subunit B
MPGRKWKEEPLKWSFWSLNLGLIFMVMLSMLPVGILQAWASIEQGTWYARSSEFMQSATMQSLRWMRVPGDILFTIGAVLFGWFVIGLLTGHSFDDKATLDRSSWSEIEEQEQDLALAGR